jgi:hypothetical protein
MNNKTIKKRTSPHVQQIYTNKKIFKYWKSGNMTKAMSAGTRWLISNSVERVTLKTSSIFSSTSIYLICTL